MEKNSLLLADTDFASQPSNGCHLLLKISEDGFSYAILDQEQNVPKVLFSIEQSDLLLSKISKIFNSDRFLSLNFASVKAAVQTSNFLFIPEDLYEEKYIDNYKHFLNYPDEIKKCHHKNLSLVTLLGLQPELKSLLPEKTVFFPILSPLWICLNASLDPCFLVDFGARSVSFLYQKSGTLLFQNSFAVSNIEEFNYFLLLLMQELNLVETIPVLIQGLADEHDDYTNCLKKYFLEVRLNIPNNLAYNQLTDQMPTHYFNTLLAIHLCE
ncbi:hypothetical protein ACVWYG_000365 [Pedobacter sp. UYEF25]